MTRSPISRPLGAGRLLLFLGITIALSSAAAAQTEASPSDLHDCTTLTDPAKLQQCIIETQGGRKIRGKLTSTPKGSDAPIYENSETPDRKVAPLSSGPP